MVAFSVVGVVIASESLVFLRLNFSVKECLECLDFGNQLFDASNRALITCTARVIKP